MGPTRTGHVLRERPASRGSRGVFGVLPLLGLVALGTATCTAPDSDAPALPSAPPTLVEETRIDGDTEALVPIAGYRDPDRTLAVHPDGRIAIGQSQDAEVRVFGPDGTSLLSVGGPGELLGISRIGWSGDSLWVIDPRQERMTFFGPAGDVVRTARLPVRATPAPDAPDEVPDFEFVYPASPVADGLLLAELSPYVGQELPQGYFDRVTWGVVDADGVIREEVIRVSSGDVQVTNQAGEAFVLPFPNRTVDGVSRDGSLLAFARALLDGPEAPSVRVTAVRLSGDTVFDRSYPFEPVAIPDSVVARYTTAGLDLPVPDVFPPLDGVVVGHDGTVWVEMIEIRGERNYTVLGPAGDLLTTLTLSGDARIAAAERERIWVVERDALDVESVVVYRLEWR